MMKVSFENEQMTYTDYPKEGAQYSRSLEVIWIVDYDGDKYVTVRRGFCLSNNLEKIKRGYVYRNRRRVPFKHKTLEKRLKFGLTTNQWDLLWALVDEGFCDEMDIETVRDVLGFHQNTVDSLIGKGYLNWVVYANGEHVFITDAGHHMLNRFADSV